MAEENLLLKWLRDAQEMRGVGQNALTAITRGIVPTTLGGPVDLANLGVNAAKAAYGYAGHKTGLLSADQIPQLDERPVGGSEWIADKMQQGGLLGGYRNPLAETIAGGLLAPLGGAAVANRAPQIARGLLQMSENALAPSTMANQGQRGMAYIPKNELIEILAGQVKANKGNKIGLRVLPDEQTLGVGDALPPSFKWVNGNQTTRQLVGASTASVGRGSTQDLEAAIKNLGLYENGPNGYYFGKKIALVGGDGASTGADVGEKVIKNGRVLWIDDNPRYQK